MESCFHNNFELGLFNEFFIVAVQMTEMAFILEQHYI